MVYDHDHGDGLTTMGHDYLVSVAESVARDHYCEAEDCLLRDVWMDGTRRLARDYLLGWRKGGYVIMYLCVWEREDYRKATTSHGHGVLLLA